MRNTDGFLSITATVWSPVSSRAASSDPTRPQPMITTCTRHLPVRMTPAIVSGRPPSGGLDGHELAGVVALAAVFARDPLVAQAAGAALGAPALGQVGLGGQEHLGEGGDPLLGLLGGVVGGLAD